MYIHRNDEMRNPGARGSCVSHRWPCGQPSLGSHRGWVLPSPEPALALLLPRGGVPRWASRAQHLGGAHKQCSPLPGPRAGVFPDLYLKRAGGGPRGCSLQGPVLGQPTCRVHVPGPPWPVRVRPLLLRWWDTMPPPRAVFSDLSQVTAMVEHFSCLPASGSPLL